ncbi:MAG: hypothetical protein Q8L37_03445 [Candidatus Gottesmanbacteria bacterium]|nr:hypothetical protein [Candidatus Gottesmanbacteria bacterium]
MIIEVDQSGRVEDLSTGTAIAFANGISGAVFVNAGAKRKLIVHLRRNSFIPAKDLPAIIFSVILFILIEDHTIDILKIDEEYTGKNEIIEETLKKLFFQNRIKRIPSVRFVRIGKLAAAHKLAWRVHRSKGRLAETKRISEKKILKYIQ